MENSISRRLANSFDAYTYFPFESRFESFKDKKMYFLDSLSEEEIHRHYHEYIFFHFCFWHLLNQKKTYKRRNPKIFLLKKKIKMILQKERTRVLTFVYFNLHPKLITLSKSFNDFRNENRYFLDGLSKSQVKLEFDRFLFFETCRILKLLGQLKLDRSEINNFLDEIKRGTKKGTEN